MENDFKISVLMGVYNEEKYVGQAITSILNQTFDNFEFIIVNDGSTDNTLKILNDYAQKDNRIRIINQTNNTGLTKALNNGLQYCDGKYIARMDGNDMAHATRFEKQIHFLEKNKDYAVVGTWREEFWPDTGKKRRVTLPTKNKDLQRTLVKGSCIGHSTTMIRGSILRDYKYNEYFKNSQDNELWARIGKKYKFANLPEVLTQISRIKGSITDSKKILRNLNYQIRIRYKAYKNLDCPWWYFVYIFKPIIEAIAPKKLVQFYINLKPNTQK